MNNHGKNYFEKPIPQGWQPTALGASHSLYRKARGRTENRRHMETSVCYKITAKTD